MPTRKEISGSEKKPALNANPYSDVVMSLKRVIYGASRGQLFFSVMVTEEGSGLAMLSKVTAIAISANIVNAKSLDVV